MKKILSILGSTGSVGQSTLKIVNKKKNFFKIYLLSANKNFNLISKQIIRYDPKYFVITNNNIFKKIKKNLEKKSTNLK